MRRPSVITSCIADRFHAPNERIIEFSSEAGGGLISFRILRDGSLVVDVYRTDDNVFVEGPRRPTTTAVAMEDK